MHRGGTSALAGTAVRLGLALPRTPLPASNDNPSGFFESVPVVSANHHILMAAGCFWNVCLTFDPDRLDEILPVADRQFILKTLLQEFGGPAPFVLKDPRLCLTLPAWRPALQTAECVVRVLIVLRHPAEVVRSLAVRNGFPESQSAPHWLHHMLEAERASRGLRRAIVTYDGLMRDWRSCMASAGEIADVTWPRPIAVAARDIDPFLAAARRHHRAEDDFGPYRPRAHLRHDPCGMARLPAPGHRSRGACRAGVARSGPGGLRGLAAGYVSAWISGGARDPIRPAMGVVTVGERKAFHLASRSARGLFSKTIGMRIAATSSAAVARPAGVARAVAVKETDLPMRRSTVARISSG